MTIKINATKVLLYILIIACILLGYNNYRLMVDIDTVHVRIDENVDALNGWAYWVEDNMFRGDAHEQILGQQDKINRHVLVQNQALIKRIQQLELLEIERQKDRRTPHNGYIYSLQQGELSVLCQSQEVIGL